MFHRILYLAKGEVTSLCKKSQALGLAFTASLLHLSSIISETFVLLSIKKFLNDYLRYYM